MNKPVKSDLEVLSGAVALDDLKNVVGGGRFDPVDGGIWDEPASGMHLEPQGAANPSYTNLTYGDGGIVLGPIGHDPHMAAGDNQVYMPFDPRFWHEVGSALQPAWTGAKGWATDVKGAGTVMGDEASHAASAAGHAIKHFFHHW